jgi:uncharacterized protein with HEPN domain
VKDESTYLTHAIEAIDAIADYTADGQKAFFSDGKTQDAVIRNIEIIGQAVKGATPSKHARLKVAAITAASGSAITVAQRKRTVALG